MCGGIESSKYSNHVPVFGGRAAGRFEEPTQALPTDTSSIIHKYCSASLAALMEPQMIGASN